MSELNTEGRGWYRTKAVVTLELDFTFRDDDSVSAGQRMLESLDLLKDELNYDDVKVISKKLISSKYEE
jgi:hypothetical protein